MEHDGAAKWSAKHDDSGYSRINSRKSLASKNHQMVSFDFIYNFLAPYYPANGGPSFEPVSMFKMLLVGYLYGIKSER